MLQHLKISDYKTNKGELVSNINLSYEVFGQPLGVAPIILVNHALTGNSTVIGENGWWNGFIGKGNCIDTDYYSIISFNVPGNGFDNDENYLIQDHTLLNARDVANLFLIGLKELGVSELYAVIGGSVGGGIAWEIAAASSIPIQHLVPIAGDWKSTDWLKANCKVQEQILLHSSDPIHDARLHAMLMYRSPESLKQKFNRSFNADKGMYDIESWLLHHGDKLNQRYTLQAYKTLNHILANIDITEGTKSFKEVVEKIDADIHIISVDSDLFFTLEEDKQTYEELKSLHKNVTHQVISSIHGHDAFLIEVDKLSALLVAIFKKDFISFEGK